MKLRWNNGSVLPSALGWDAMSSLTWVRLMTGAFVHLSRFTETMRTQTQENTLKGEQKIPINGTGGRSISYIYFKI